jgi:hypothetical protein
MPLLSGARAARWFGAFFAILMASSAVQAGQGNALEYAVKASYLTKFGPFVAWPPAAMADGGSVRLCVVGADPFGAILDEAVRGVQLQGHALTVSRMSAVTQQSASSCQIMFIGKPTAQPTLATLGAVAGLPVLTVTDRSRGVAGGMIQFVIEGGRVRFDVDEAEADQSGLQISSKLLALAVTVKR